MFYSLTGKIVYVDESSVALDCGGVAFRLYTTLNTLRKCADIGQTQTLFTHLNVREDALDLFGFADKNELEFTINEEYDAENFFGKVFLWKGLTNLNPVTKCADVIFGQPTAE